MLNVGSMICTRRIWTEVANMLNISWILNADIQKGKIINNIVFICIRDCNGVY